MFSSELLVQQKEHYVYLQNQFDNLVGWKLLHADKIFVSDTEKIINVKTNDATNTPSVRWTSGHTIRQ